MILIDTAELHCRGKLYCHMASDNPAELHALAARLGVKRCWFHHHRHHNPHYDIPITLREAAVVAGAKLVTPRELVRSFR